MLRTSNFSSGCRRCLVGGLREREIGFAGGIHLGTALASGFGLLGGRGRGCLRRYVGNGVSTQGGLPNGCLFDHKDLPTLVSLIVALTVFLRG